jgi:pre-rRNA-processing protein TSR2
MDVLRGAVKCVLAAWPALRVAVDQGFGGDCSREKEEWMSLAMAQVLTENRDLEVDEVEMYLNDIMYEEFHTVVDDGSLGKIARDLLTAYQLWSQQAGLELEHWLQDNCVPIAAVEAKRQEAAEDKPAGDEDKASARLEKMEEGPSGGNEHEVSLNCGAEDPSEQVAMEVEDDSGGWQVVRRTRRK